MALIWSIQHIYIYTYIYIYIYIYIYAGYFPYVWLYTSHENPVPIFGATPKETAQIPTYVTWGTLLFPIYTYPTIQWLRGSGSEPGVSIFPINSLWNGEPRSYFEFPNHLVANYRWIARWTLGHKMDPILEMIFPNERIGLEPWMDGFLVQVGTSHEDTQERFKSICIYIYREIYTF